MKTAERRRTGRLQGKTEITARPAAQCEESSGSTAGFCPPDGCAAYRRVHYGLRPARKRGHPLSGARDIADRLLSSLTSMLLYWYHYAFNDRRIDTETDDDTCGGHFLHLLHGKNRLKTGCVL